MTYQYSKNLRLPFEEVVVKLTNTLHQEGFSMVSTMDVRDRMETEFGIRFRNYKILSVCNPEVSYKAISLEPHIGILLPCNIVIQEHENGQIEVSAVNPMETLDQNMTTPSLELLAADISTRLRAALDTIETKKKTFSFSYN
jgi:uncharacterized protein (DUF302 family)